MNNLRYYLPCMHSEYIWIHLPVHDTGQVFTAPSSHATVPPRDGEVGLGVPNCFATFARQQRELYFRMDVLPDEDWPPSIGRHESNLVMIEHGRFYLPGAKEAEEMQRDYLGGRVDRIVERKKEIGYEHIFDFKAAATYESKHFRMLIDGAPGQFAGYFRFRLRGPFRGPFGRACAPGVCIACATQILSPRPPIWMSYILCAHDHLLS